MVFSVDVLNLPPAFQLKFHGVSIMHVETIETERLYLRGFQKEDALRKWALKLWMKNVIKSVEQS